MAKEQGLSLNPTKISGSCGRLMCCLKYEQDTYEELIKMSPKVGAVVMTPEGRGVVTDSNILTGKIKVRLDKSPDSPAVEMTRDDLNAVVRDSRPKAELETESVPAEDAPVQETPKQEKPHTGNKPHGDKPHQGNKPHGEKPQGGALPHSERQKRSHFPWS
jgi:hypothetical protein